MLSRVFPKGHIHQGEPTGFRDKLLSGEKIHTIRTNFPLWEKRIKEVQNGEACISVRQWQNKPYRSKQIEVTKLTAKNGIGIQKITISRSEWEEYDNMPHFCYWTTVGDKEIQIEDVARHDGFDDCFGFISWFDKALNTQQPDEEGWRHVTLPVIHFTSFRYNNG